MAVDEAVRKRVNHLFTHTAREFIAVCDGAAHFDYGNIKRTTEGVSGGGSAGGRDSDDVLASTTSSSLATEEAMLISFCPRSFDDDATLRLSHWQRHGDDGWKRSRRKDTGEC